LPAVVRAIEGHCLLALNRNDESLGMFISLYASDARAQWDTWTDSFVRQHPGSATAAYLRGDALARLGDWKRALEEYDKALVLRPGFGVCLNARGIAQLKQGDQFKAKRDFEQATKTDPDFADAQASLGSFWLRGGAPESAEPCFVRALQISSNFALAMNGRGCAMFIFTTNDQAAFDLFKTASLSPIIAPLAYMNANRVLEAEAEVFSNAVADGSAGTTVSVADIKAQLANLNDSMLRNSVGAGWMNGFGNMFDGWGKLTPLAGGGYALAGSPAGAGIAFGSSVAGAAFSEIAANLKGQAGTLQNQVTIDQAKFSQDMQGLMAMAPAGSPQNLALQNLRNSGVGNSMPGGATMGGTKTPREEIVRMWFGLAQDIATGEMPAETH
jgi:tetratricopeptide (TPR) repeat protein